MIEEFVKPEVPVKAIQFTNQLGNTLEIFEWLHGCFYIAQGEDSEHRTLLELDDEGLPKREAAPFLIIKTRSGEDRVNVGDWIVKYDDTHISTYTDLDFTYKFQKAGK